MKRFQPSGNIHNGNVPGGLPVFLKIWEGMDSCCQQTDSTGFGKPDDTIDDEIMLKLAFFILGQALLFLFVQEEIEPFLVSWRWFESHDFFRVHACHEVGYFIIDTEVVGSHVDFYLLQK